MSKLGNSLRQSISAEKASVAKQASIEIAPIKVSALSKPDLELGIADITPDEYALLNSLRTKLMRKNVPAIHHYEIIRILNELNLINKNADYIINSTNKTIDLVNKVFQNSIANLDEVTRSNLEVVKTILNSSSDIFRTMNPMSYWLNNQSPMAMMNKLFVK